MKIKKSVTLMDVLFMYSIKIHAKLPPVMFCLDRKCIVVNSRCV